MQAVDNVKCYNHCHILLNVCINFRLFLFVDGNLEVNLKK